MAARKRTRLQREAQLVEIEELHGNGMSLRLIGAYFGLSARVIHRDLQTVARRYLEQQLAERRLSVEVELDEIREARQAAWQAWEASKQDREQRVECEQHVAVIVKTLEDEATLLGLYAGTMTRPTARPAMVEQGR